MSEEFDALEAAKNDVPTEIEQEQDKETAQESAAPQEEGGQEVSKSAGDSEQRWVPLPHLLRERESRQEYESRVKSLEDEINALKGRVDQAPDYDDDPRAYIDHRFDRLEETLKGSPKISKEDIASQIQDVYLQNTINQDVQASRSKHADYDAALNHVRTVLFNQHLLSGLPEKEAWDATINGEMQMARTLLAQGQSPSEAVYNYASQIGYKGKEKKKPDDKISQIEEGQKASTPAGAGDAGGKGDKEDVDLFDQAMSEAFAFMKK